MVLRVSPSRAACHRRLRRRAPVSDPPTRHRAANARRTSSPSGVVIPCARIPAIWSMTAIALLQSPRAMYSSARLADSRTSAAHSARSAFVHRVGLTCVRSLERYLVMPSNVSHHRRRLRHFTPANASTLYLSTVQSPATTSIAARSDGARGVGVELGLGVYASHRRTSRFRTRVEGSPLNHRGTVRLMPRRLSLRRSSRVKRSYPP